MKKDQHTALLTQARTAVTGKNYVQADKLLADANKLIPDQPAAKALAADLARAKNQDATSEKIHTLVAGARKAIGTKDLVNAEKDLAEAARLAPTDPEVVAARAELARAKSSTTKVQDDYKLAMDAARSALKKLDYQGGINAANVALGIIPNDPAALALLKDAQAGKVATDGEAKRKADYIADVQAARTALTAKRYDDAIKSASDALKLLPGDLTAGGILRDAQAAKVSADGEAKRRADYSAQIALGQQALTAKHSADAVRAFTEALRLMPGDPAATKGLADARALDKPVTPPPPPPALPDYNKSMQTGQTFLLKKSWGEASAAYQDALKAKPADAKASFGLDMAEGQRALDAKKYADAQKWFEDALRHVPTDADAKALLKRAKDMK